MFRKISQLLKTDGINIKPSPVKQALNNLMEERGKEVQRKITGIKFRITDNFKLARAKNILTKDVGKRTEADIDFIVNLIQQIDFFREQKQLNYGELRDLASSFTYEKAASDKEIISCGHPVTNNDKFYIILDGTVSVQKRNPLIDDWDWAMSVYNALLDWKEKEFDKRIAKAMNLYFQRYQRDIAREIDDRIAK